jgi:hypothetical protein
MTSRELVKKLLLQMWLMPVQILVLVVWLLSYAATAGTMVNLAFAGLFLVMLLGDYLRMQQIMRLALLKFLVTQMATKTSDSEPK